VELPACRDIHRGPNVGVPQQFLLHLHVNTKRSQWAALY